MEPKTLEALRESIAHHQNNKAVPHQRTMGASSCALCGLFRYQGPIVEGQIYRRNSNADCGGCPVREKTGEQYCIGTPWGEVEYTESKMAEEGNDYDEDCPFRNDFQLAEGAEIAFLKSLLPQT